MFYLFCSVNITIYLTITKLLIKLLLCMPHKSDRLGDKRHHWDKETNTCIYCGILRHMSQGKTFNGKKQGHFAQYLFNGRWTNKLPLCDHSLCINTDTECTVATGNLHTTFINVQQTFKNSFNH